MKAVVCTKYGAPDVLQVREVAKPVPKEKEILIRIHATTVTAGDCEMRAFMFPAWLWLPLRLAFGITKPRNAIFGQELAGVVEAVGQEVTNFRVGDALFAPTTFSLGAHAEFITLPADYAIAHKPDNVSFAEAAASPVGGLNAIHFLNGNIRQGQRVLINGAGGSIGSFGVQLAKHFGAEVVAVDSKGKLEMLRSIGADRVIDYRQEDFTQSGELYDVIFDVVGKSSFARCQGSLRPEGLYISANPRIGVMVRGLLHRGKQRIITGVASYKPAEVALLRELLEAGTVKPFIDRSYALEQVADAHRYVEIGEKKGSLVITMSGEHPTT